MFHFRDFYYIFGKFLDLVSLEGWDWAVELGLEAYGGWHETHRKSGSLKISIGFRI